MYRYYVLFAVVVFAWASGCKSTPEIQINKDIAGVYEQLYDLDMKQIKHSIHLKKIESNVKKIAKKKETKKDEAKIQDSNAIYKDGFKNYLEQNHNKALKLINQYCSSDLYETAILKIKQIKKTNRRR